MRKKGALVIFCMIFMLFSYTAGAALIHGSLYDLNLDEVGNVVVEINTEPKQQMVSKNGSYFFNVPQGKYTITAKQFSGNEITANAEENLTVSGEGAFVLDMILFPSFEEEEQILTEADFDIDTVFIEEETNYIAIAALIIAIVAFFFILRLRGKDILKQKGELEQEESDEINKVVDFIKKEGGRTTQKEIRKHFPQSEAKISLVISELESDNRIKKIKKGRGNIIILNK